MPMNKQMKKAAKGILSGGAAGLSNKGAGAFAAQKGQTQEMQCPYCDRIFKQLDRLRMHKEKHHADILNAEAEGTAASAEASSSAAAAAAQPASAAAASTKHDLATQFQLSAKSSTTAAAAKLAEAQAAAKAAREAKRAAAQGLPPPTQPPNPPQLQQQQQTTQQPMIRRPQTSKTPRGILQEWLQKHKKNKPRYRVTEKADGKFTCKVVLPDKFKPDNDVVLFCDDVHASKDDAEDAAAVLALARVGTNLPLERILPECWRGPFSKAVKGEKDREKARRSQNAKKAPPPKKVVEVPQVFLTEDNRRIVEAALHAELEDGSDVKTVAFEEWLTTLDDADADACRRLVELLVPQLEKLGFQTHDARRAAEVSAREVEAGAFAAEGADAWLNPKAAYREALDWLCTELPENELPARFAPQHAEGAVKIIAAARTSTSTTNVVATEDVSSITPEMHPLVARGYAPSVAAAALADSRTTLGSLAHLFGAQLRAAATTSAAVNVAAAWPAATSTAKEVSSSSGDAWQEECEALAAMYGDDATFHDCDNLGDASASLAAVALPYDGPPSPGREGEDTSVDAPSVVLEAYRFDTLAYPQTVPMFALRVSPSSHVSQLALGDATRRLAAAGLVHAMQTAADGAWEPILVSLAAETCTFVAEAVEAENRGELLPETTTTTTTSTSKDRAQTPREALGEASHSKQQQQQQQQQPARRRGGHRRGRDEPPLVPSATAVAAESAQLKTDWDAYQSGRLGASAVAMKAQRERLPAYEARQSLIDACERPCVVVSGETGCGKSTQVPQYILESMIEDGDGGAAFIVVAQPRRVAATSLAERVASERSERCGDVVGYSVRLDTKRSRRTRLLFCTTGVLLQMLIRDPKLVGVTHVVVDEVHERSVEGDLLLLMLRRALVRDMERIAKGVSAGGVRGNRPLKAVMMSATANASLFCEYFERAGMESATMHIPGFTHPVREHFLEDVFEMTGYRVGKGSKYAKRGQKAAAAKAALAEAAEREKLAERARHRERLEAEAASARLEAMSLQADSWEELADGSGIGGDDDDDSATPMLPVAPASAKPTLEVPTPEEEELLWNAPATAASDRAAEAGEEAEAKRLARDELARARQHFEELGEATRRSTEQVDEEILNPDILVEAVRLVLLRHGDGGLIPPPSAKRAPAAADAAPAILVFLSGAAPIFKCMRRLDSASQPGMRLCEDEVGHRLLVLPLHGSLPPREQRKVFARPPKNSVKVILATNVAETSLTIDDVQYVIDFGKVNESRHDAARGLSVLAETWCSRAAAKQRRGRAGRTRPGACVRLYSRFTFWGDMPHQQAPEIVRTPLEPLILRIKAILGARVPVREVISEALTAPPQESVDAAVDALRSMGALSDETSPSAPVLEVLTPLGRHLSLLPVDPRVGKLLVFGSILSCLDEVLTIAACLGEKSMFPPPAHDASEEDRKERKLAIRSLLLPTVRDGEDADEVDPSGALSAKAATTVASDHMLDAYAFDAWRRARSRNGERGARAFADAHFADGNLMSNIAASRIEFAEALLERGFCDADFVERQRRALDDTSALAALGAPAPHRVVKAALLAAYYPHVLRVQHPKATYVETSGGSVRTDGDASQVKFFSSDGSRVFLHPSSLAFDISKYACPWLVVTDKAETQPLQQAAASKAKQNAFAGRPRVVARAVSMASPYALLLFGGELEVVHEKSLVRVGKWVEYGAPARVGVLVRRLRGSLDRALLRKVEDPQFDVGATAAARACLKLVVGDGKV